MPNVAPKTQVMPVGRKGYWAFGCCDRHHTYQNVIQQGEFVINFPGPELIKQVSQSAKEFPPDADEINGAGLTAMASQEVKVPSVAECRVHLECKRYQVIDGYGKESLIVGEVVAVTADEDLVDAGAEILMEYPLLVYVYPGYYASVEQVRQFRFPRNYKP
jgi:flavin reductase (DIM6/NTAB) family NADH-FMN oxidoreductase RutF